LRIALRELAVDLGAFGFQSLEPRGDRRRVPAVGDGVDQARDLLVEPLGGGREVGAAFLGRRDGGVDLAVVALEEVLEGLDLHQVVLHRGEDRGEHDVVGHRRRVGA